MVHHFCARYFRPPPGGVGGKRIQQVETAPGCFFDVLVIAYPTQIAYITDMKITAAEGQTLTSVKKWGEPLNEWSQDRPHTYTNSFGVVDELGQSIKGLYIELNVFISPRLKIVRYVFSLMQQVPGCHARVYQLDIPLKEGLKPSDHDYPHEHYGTETEGKSVGKNNWLKATLSDAVNIFCEKCNLTLTEELPDYQAFSLK